jgi:hypothetical protein
MILLIGCTTSRRVATLTTVKLDGSKSKVLNGDGKGHINNWNWRQIKGATYPIDNYKSMVTQTKVVKGTFAWELTGIDNLGNIGKDTFNITIQ